MKAKEEYCELAEGRGKMVRYLLATKDKKDNGRRGRVISGDARR